MILTDVREKLRLDIGRQAVDMRNRGVDALVAVGFPRDYAWKAITQNLVASSIADERQRDGQPIYATRQGVINCYLHAIDVDGEQIT